MQYHSKDSDLIAGRIEVWYNKTYQMFTAKLYRYDWWTVKARNCTTSTIPRISQHHWQYIQFICVALTPKYSNSCL